VTYSKFSIACIVFIFASSASAESRQPVNCMKKIKSIVAAIAAVDFSLPKNSGYLPTIRWTDLKGDKIQILLDMQRSDGTILNGSRGGSSAYQVDILQNLSDPNQCFIVKVEIADEPSASPSVLPDGPAESPINPRWGLPQ
jgi:hypothetical protein